MPQIYQIDIAQLDKEIGVIKTQIADLQAKLELRQQFREFAINAGEPIKGIAASEPASYGNVNLDIPLVPVKANAGFRSVHDLGISEFILAYIKYRVKVDTKHIIQAYADAVKKPYNDVRNNVFNTLNRLKKADRIEAIDSDDSNVSVYSIKQNRAENSPAA